MDRKPQRNLQPPKLAWAIAWAFNTWPAYTIGGPHRA